MGKTIAQALIEEGKEMGKAEGVEVGRKLGKTEGMELGKEVGIVTAKQEYVIELLRRRVASFPQVLIDKIRSIHEVEQLNALFHFAITAETADELEIKLAEMSTES